MKPLTPKIKTLVVFFLLDLMGEPRRIFGRRLSSLANCVPFDQTPSMD